tara:strand:+ start:7736 stop:8254 length:519 start_codon:yes stop_codon:yes gene_type:complete
MAITKEKKQEIIKGLSEKLKSAESVVFVNFHGLSVGENQELRQKLRENGSSFVVAKKTLMKRVLSEEKIEGSTPELNGELAVSFGDDLTSSAKSIYEFTKTHKEQINILGGIIEGSYVSCDQVVSLAQIPSREALYGQLVYVINAPTQNFVSVLGNTVGSFVSTLSEIAKIK